MDSSSNETMDQAESAPAWGPIGTVERRILGVLVEKSKTTPDVYPMTINSIRVAANQKSNRKPLMQLSADDIDDGLLRLREIGAVAEIHGDGRTLKYKHKLYNWMGVEKIELAVMAELLLRGEQSIGDLRGRASRMEKIADVAELRPIMDALIKKNLVIPLTGPGRGQIVTHNLYLPEQLEKLQSQFESASATVADIPATASPAEKREAMKQLTQRMSELESLVERLDQEVNRIKELLS